MKYEIRPIEKDRWHGIKGGEKDFTRPVSFNCLIDEHTGRYAVALADERLAALEEITGWDLDTKQKPEGKPHPFYDEANSRIRLPYYPVFFDTANPKDEITIAIIKRAPMVANSLEEYLAGDWPEATHYIYSEEEETRAKESAIALQDEAVALKMAMSKDQKVAIVRIILGRNVSGKTDNFVNVAAQEAIEKDVKAFLRYAKMDADDLSVYHLVLKCLDKGILMKDGVAILYGTDRLGFSEDEAVTYLQDPKNQPVRIRLMEMVS